MPCCDKRDEQPVKEFPYNVIGKKKSWRGVVRFHGKVYSKDFNTQSEALAWEKKYSQECILSSGKATAEDTRKSVENTRELPISELLSRVLKDTKQARVVGEGAEQSLLSKAKVSNCRQYGYVIQVQSGDVGVAVDRNIDDIESFFIYRILRGAGLSTKQTLSTIETLGWPSLRYGTYQALRPWERALYSTYVKMTNSVSPVRHFVQDVQTKPAVVPTKSAADSRIDNLILCLQEVEARLCSELQGIREGIETLVMLLSRQHDKKTKSEAMTGEVLNQVLHEVFQDVEKGVL